MPGVRATAGLAYDLARQIWDSGIRGPDGLTVLGMAMGIYMEAQEGSHRNLQPVAEALVKSAQLTFDAFRQGRNSIGSA